MRIDLKIREAGIFPSSILAVMDSPGIPGSATFADKAAASFAIKIFIGGMTTHTRVGCNITLSVERLFFFLSILIP